MPAPHASPAPSAGAVPAASPAGRRLAVACGGTGGHFYPGLSVALEWQRQGGRAMLLVAGSHRDEQAAAGHREGLAAQILPAPRLPGNPLLWPAFGWDLWQATRAAKQMLIEHDMEVVLGMGSFASVPVGLAAWRRHLPLVVHDGNARLGQANRYLSRAARHVALAYPLVGRPPYAPTQLVGMPLRQALIDAATAPPPPPSARAAWCQELGLDPALPTLLVFGGSLGASFINEQARHALHGWRAPVPCQAIHLFGGRANHDVAALGSAYQGAGMRAWVRPFDPRMEVLYGLADFVICRAGGATIAELCLFGKPALLIPYAAAKDNHQCDNAASLVAAGGAQLMEEHDCSPAAVRAALTRWLTEPALLRAQGERARTLARPRAAADLVALLAATLPPPAPRG